MHAEKRKENTFYVLNVCISPNSYAGNLIPQVGGIKEVEKIKPWGNALMNKTSETYKTPQSFLTPYIVKG